VLQVYWRIFVVVSSLSFQSTRRCKLDSLLSDRRNVLTGTRQTSHAEASRYRSEDSLRQALTDGWRQETGGYCLSLYVLKLNTGVQHVRGNEPTTLLLYRLVTVTIDPIRLVMVHNN